MSNYKSLIDEAMRTAQYRLNAGVEKTASVTESNLIKEASELANALEYLSLEVSNDGSAVGSARAEMIRDFHKSATAQRLGIKLAGDIGESATMTSGTQSHAPESGKTKLMAKKEVNGNPMVTSSPDSKGHTMLESFKQADSGTTLYDMLMHQKEAGDVGEYDSEQYMSITGANENSNRRILDDASILSGVSKQEAKAPVRDRLREAFATTSDSLGDQTVRSIFPTAYQHGGLKKTASSPLEDFLEKEAGISKAERRAKRKASQAKKKEKALNKAISSGTPAELDAIDAAEKRKTAPKFTKKMKRKAEGAMKDVLKQNKGRKIRPRGTPLSFHGRSVHSLPPVAQKNLAQQVTNVTNYNKKQNELKALKRAENAKKRQEHLAKQQEARKVQKAQAPKKSQKGVLRDLRRHNPGLRRAPIRIDRQAAGQLKLREYESSKPAPTPTSATAPKKPEAPATAPKKSVVNTAADSVSTAKKGLGLKGKVGLGLTGLGVAGGGAYLYSKKNKSSNLEKAASAVRREW